MTKEAHSVQSSSAAKHSGDEIEQTQELSEDMELISPGSMLREAREKLSLSQNDIANRLNFKVSIVTNIEQDIYDKKLPTTFNRGYLANYAKLVAVDVEEVLASYDVLDAANTQRSEMLSFSKLTVKEAEHSRVMWLSYLILIALVGLTALWWQQDNQQTTSIINDALSTKAANESSQKVALAVKTDSLEISSKDGLNEKALENKNSESIKETIASNVSVEKKSVITVENSQNAVAASAFEPEKQAVQTAQVQTQTLVDEQLQTETPLISRAVFTFSGDCWVNIYDATGERIAWGIKKVGYIMNIEGVAPLRITLGKPELASIVFNDQVVDMSTFDRGNIAKFTLPLTP